MAASDCFELLLRDVSKSFSHGRDILALAGFYYLAKKTLTMTYAVIHEISDIIVIKASSQIDFRRRFGPWAVITGSSEGIGRAYAFELARRNLNVILVSKGEHRLKKTAAEITDLYGVQVITIHVDFTSNRDVYETIHDAIVDKEIGLLVNNVGVMYDYPNYFLNISKEKLWQLIDVNITAATIMTHMLLPQMLERRRGAIVMMSSQVSTQVSPQLTVYAATKRYLDYFTQSLAYEYRHSGVVIQSLKPGFVATKMTRYSETLSHPSLFIPTASIYASHAVTSLGVKAQTAGYWPHTIQAWLCGCLPERVYMWGAMRLNSALRRQAIDRTKDQRARLISESSAETDPSPPDESKTFLPT